MFDGEEYHSVSRYVLRFICGELWYKDCIGPQDVMKEVEKICRNFDGLPPQTLSAKHIWVMACKKDDLVGKWLN